MFDVTVKSRGDDDTESLFAGTREQCMIYLQGYIDCLIVHTAYYQHPDSSLELMIYYSPLISEDTLLFEIVERPTA